MYYICEIEKGEIYTLVATFDCRKKCYKYGSVLYTTQYQNKVCTWPQNSGEPCKDSPPKIGGREQLTEDPYSSFTNTLS